MLTVESRVKNTQGFLNKPPPSINLLRHTPDLARALAQPYTNDTRALRAMTHYFKVPLDSALLQRIHETLQRTPPDYIGSILGMRLYAPAAVRTITNLFQHNYQHCTFQHMIKPLLDFKMILVEYPNSPDRARSFFNAGELLQLVIDIGSLLTTLKLKPTTDDEHNNSIMRSLFLGIAPLADAGSLPTGESKQWKRMYEISREKCHRTGAFTADALITALGEEVTKNDVTLQRYGHDPNGNDKNVRDNDDQDPTGGKRGGKYKPGTRAF